MMDCAACNMYFLILFKVWTFNKLEKIYKQVADLAQCIYIINFYVLLHFLLIQVRLPAACVQCFKLQELQDKAFKAMHC